jgi:hypothetical protein
MLFYIYMIHCSYPERKQLLRMECLLLYTTNILVIKITHFYVFLTYSLLSWYVNIQHTYCRHSRYSVGCQFLLCNYIIQYTKSHSYSRPYNYRLTIGCIFTTLWAGNQHVTPREKTLAGGIPVHCTGEGSWAYEGETHAGLIKLHNEIFYVLCYSTDTHIIMLIKCRRNS